MKKAISLILSLLVAVSVCAVLPFASAAEAGYVVFNNCDEIYDMEAMKNTNPISRDTENKVEGEACVAIDLPASGVKKEADVFAMMVAVNTEEAVNTNNYPIVDYMLWVSHDMDPETAGGMQTNLIDTDYQQHDGFNLNTNIKGWTQGWHRVTLDNLLNTELKPNKPANRNHISRMRVSWLLYGGPDHYYETDFKIDNIIFMNKETYDARTAAESALSKTFDALTVPTAETVDSLEAEILAAKAALEDARSKYPNVYVENIAKYNSVMSAYWSFRKSDLENAAKEKIAAIGDVTLSNYTEKLAAINEATTALDTLKEHFGTDFSVENIDVYNAAVKAYDDCAAASSVISAIGALTAYDEITLVDKFPISEARKAYDALTDDQKALVGEDNLATLTNAEKKIWDIEHPYTLGNVDMDEENKITATDALLALQAAVGKVELTDLQKLAAEVDGQENRTATDALLILQYSVGKINKFPIEG